MKVFLVMLTISGMACGYPSAGPSAGPTALPQFPVYDSNGTNRPPGQGIPGQSPNPYQQPNTLFNGFGSLVNSFWNGFPFFRPSGAQPSYQIPPPPPPSLIAQPQQYQYPPYSQGGQYPNIPPPPPPQAFGGPVSTIPAGAFNSDRMAVPAIPIGQPPPSGAQPQPFRLLSENGNPKHKESEKRDDKEKANDSEPPADDKDPKNPKDAKPDDKKP